MSADREAAAAGDPGMAALASFEEIYARAGADLAAVPWARLGPNPALVGWLDRQPPAAGEPALVVGCGLGDDAEELARRGYRVTAFDLSPTAIGWCHRRFPGSPVAYQVADLFALPAAWRGAFSLTVEIRTIQSLPLGRREAVIATIAGTAAPGGRVFVHCEARGDDEPAPYRPWPVSRRELGAFTAAGLREAEFTATPQPRSFTAVYER
jgi:SAM-dependent methyltransferase